MGISFGKIGIIVLVLLILVLGGGCLKQKIKSPFKQKQENKPIESFTPLSKNEPIDGSKLKTKSLDLSPKIIRNHRALELTFSPDDRADYLEITICNEQQEACNPDPSNPGIITSDTYQVADPPPGLINVALRSCARSYNTTERKDTCGSWISKKYYQLPNKASEAKSLLASFHEQELIIRQACQKIHSDISSYFEENQSYLENIDSEASQQLVNLLHNNMVIGEDRCAELYLNNVLELVEKDFEYSSANDNDDGSFRLLEGDDKNVGASLILTVGSLAFLGGSYQVGSNLLSLQNLNKEITQLKSRYDETLVSIRQKLNISAIRRENLDTIVNSYEQAKLEYEQDLKSIRQSVAADDLNQRLGEAYPSQWDQADFKRIDQILLSPYTTTLPKLGLNDDLINRRLNFELEKFRLLHWDLISRTDESSARMNNAIRDYEKQTKQFFVGEEIRKEFQTELDTQISNHKSKNIELIDQAFSKEFAKRSNLDLDTVKKRFAGLHSTDHLLNTKKSELQKLKATGFRPGITTAILGGLAAALAYNQLNLNSQKVREDELIDNLNNNYLLIKEATTARYQISNSIDKVSNQ